MPNIHPKVLEAIKNPNLKEFEFDDYYAQNYTKEDLSALLTNCLSLESLTVPDYYFDLSIICDLTPKLKKLHIEPCYFRELEHASFITKLSSLTHLSLVNWHTLKKFESEDYSEFFYKIAKHPSLTHLDLSGDTEYVDDEALKCLSSSSKLKSLCLGYAPYVTDEGICYIQSLKTLEKFSIKSSVSDESCEFLSKLISIRELELISEKFTDRGFKKICTMHNLNSLTFDCSLVTNSGFKHLSMLDKLSHLKILGNEYINDSGLSAIKCLENLISISLSFFILEEQMLTQLLSLKKLKNLEIRHCSEPTGIVNIICNFKELKSLHFSQPKHLNDEDLLQLNKFKNLTSIELNNCDTITNKGLMHLSKILSLRDILLDFNENITFEGLNFLLTLPNIENIYIRQCTNINPEDVKFIPKIKTHFE